MKIPSIKALLFMKEHSERVPGKNMKPLYGRPLFHWIMDSLTKSEYVRKIIINTDSIEIADSATKNFNVTINMRPDYLLDIQSNEANQIIEYDLSQTDGEYFIQSHSTNPLLRTHTINRAIESFFEKKEEYDSLMSVTALQKRYYWSDGTPVNHDPEKLIKTQKLPLIYEENSCIYIFTRSVFMKHKSRVGTKPILFPIDQFEAVDIDVEFDFLIAEALMKRRLSGTTTHGKL